MAIYGTARRRDARHQPLVRIGAGAAVILLLIASAHPNVSAQDRANIRWTGHWETVSGRSDGRTAGTSVRSFHPGDALHIDLHGTGVWLYAVTGPTGGRANVMLEDQPDQTIDFYSAAKRTHVLLYQSPHLAYGRHFATVVVIPERNTRSRGNYVNIEAVVPAR